MSDEPDEETLALIGWGWRHVPGLVLAYIVTGKESFLKAMRNIREEDQGE